MKKFLIKNWVSSLSALLTISYLLVIQSTQRDFNSTEIAYSFLVFYFLVWCLKKPVFNKK